MFVIFDLDGTLSLNEHRQHLVQGPKKDWDAFFEACDKDEPNYPAILTLAAHIAAGHTVEIWSGRSDQVRGKTRTWLNEHRIRPSRLTRMRARGDHTPDVKLKRGWLREYDMVDGGNSGPDLVYDDRDSVVAMWRAEGVPCFQVAPGDF